MNTPESRLELGVTDTAQELRLAVLRRFRVEEIQLLELQDLLVAQGLAGHGDVWGHWLTPRSLARSKTTRDIDLAGRLHDFLLKEVPSAAPVPQRLVSEGVLMLTRLALLMRLAASGGHGSGKSHRLKPSSIAIHLYTSWPRITARAIRRKTDNPDAGGLFRCLTEADVDEFIAHKTTRGELRRLNTLVARGAWADAPLMPNVRQTTDPARKINARPPQDKANPYLPLPDDWLAEIGPRVLWIVQDMGPNLLRALEALTRELKDVNWARTSWSIRNQVAKRIHEDLKRHPWLDRAGKSLSPPFRLITSFGRRGADLREWPPRTWEHFITLAVTLQAAHLFITLLASAGRIGEVANLKRACVTVGRDGKDYLAGFTYKLSPNLLGDARQWPAPEILCHCLGQQARLSAAMNSLPKCLEDGLPPTPRFGDGLWISIGAGGRDGEDHDINFNQTLGILAERLDMNPAPGGVNVHAHRFRKTIGRLAGVALFNSPLVLKRLFGHKSIEMTLHYILCDPAVREEAEKVLRELRIMHCAEALEEIHQALQSGRPLPGNGGPGAPRLVTAVCKQDEQLQLGGRVWGEGSAYDLAYLLTAQGQGWRLIKESIVCSKAPGEDGLCQKKRGKGEPDTSNCQPECSNRIVLLRRRRDTELVIEQYLDIARQARKDGQLLVLAAVMENLLDELENFSDLKDKYLASPEVQSLLALCEEPEAPERAA